MIDINISWNGTTFDLTQPNTTAYSGLVPVRSGFLFTKTSVAIKLFGFILAFICGTVGNGFVALVMWATPSLKTKRNSLLAWLIIADLLIGFTSALYLAIYQSLAFIVSTDPCQYTKVAAASFSVTTIATQAAIDLVIGVAVERYIAIVHPFEYATMITGRWSKITVSICWAVAIGRSIVHSIFIYQIDFSSCALPYSIVLQCAIEVPVYLIMASSITIMYGRIIVTIKRRSRINTNHVSAVVPQGGAADLVNKFDKELKAARSSGIILASMIISWFPYILGRFVQGIGDTRPYSQFLIDIGLSIGLFNHSMDWFIYGASSREYRNAMLDKLKTLTTLNRFVK